MNTYLMLVRGGAEGFDKLSEEEVGALMQKWGAYMGKLQESGNWVQGFPLDRGGRLLCEQRQPQEGVVGDPEVAIGGYCVLSADSYDQALELAGGCPSLDIGAKIELREAVNMD